MNPQDTFGSNRRRWILGSLVLVLAGCTSSPPSTWKAPPEAMPFDEAVLTTANKVFSKAPKPAAGRQPVVIDPLVDGLTGTESRATQSIERQIVALVEEQYPQFQVVPFTTDNLARSPQVLIGTFTGVGQSGQPEGERQTYKFYLTLLDLESDKVVSLSP